MRPAVAVSWLCVLVWACSSGGADGIANGGAADALDANGWLPDGASDAPMHDVVDAEPLDLAAEEVDLAGGETVDAAQGDLGDLPVVRSFSLAIITDIHIGEGHRDYGTEGYDDAGGEEDALIARIRASIEKIRAVRDVYDIRFVMVLGDLTDSGERSEYTMVRSLLSELPVPYFPFIGNHDIWPYYRPADGDPEFVEADRPSGDQVFEEEFGQHFEGLQEEFPSLVKAPAPCDNPEHDIDSYFQNFAFDYEGFHFVALDLNTRTHAPPEYPGIGPEADLHDFDGGTWPFLAGELAAHSADPDGSVLVFSHHPPAAMEPFSFSPEEAEVAVELVEGQGYARQLCCFFGGHWHFEFEGLLDYATVPVVVTGAAKEDSVVRVVQLYTDGSVDYQTLL